MKQVALTLIAVALIVTTALPANAASNKSSISGGTSFTLMTIPGGTVCC